MNLELRILDPVTDVELFREAFHWRSRKRHVGANESTLEDLLSDDPRQITIGVFNGEYCAMFLLYEDEPSKFSAHFTSKRGTSRETLVEAGVKIRDAFMENGATELSAWVTKRNSALKRYLTALGFEPMCHKTFSCQPASQSDTLPTAMKEFVMYVHSRR
jgi:hypothetical protein